MPKKLPVVFIRIHWAYSVERMRIDLAELKAHPKGRLITHEVWKGEEGALVYRPRMAYHADTRGTHVIELVYLQRDHPGFDEIGVLWGKSTIEVLASCTHAAANWVGEPGLNRFDGEARNVEVRPEKPAEKQAEVVAVRKAQARFKLELLKLDSACALTGETLQALLDAAHIQPVEDRGPDEIDNGILLRADLHRLYDAGYFTIKSDGTLILDKSIPDSYRAQLKGVKLRADIIERIKPYLLKRKLK